MFISRLTKRNVRAQGLTSLFNSNDAVDVLSLPPRGVVNDTA
jgi:hypothetical protein